MRLFTSILTCFFILTSCGKQSGSLLSGLKEMEDLMQKKDFDTYSHIYYMVLFADDNELLIKKPLFLFTLSILLSICWIKRYYYNLLQAALVFFLLKKGDRQKITKEVTKLRHKILFTQNTIQELQEEKTRGREINRKLKNLQERTEQLQCKMFKMTGIYATIEQLQVPDRDRKVLNQKERNLLHNELFSCFPEFIQAIKTECPSMTEDDLKLCCLSKLGLPLTVICLCFGVIGTDAVRQRKHSLKKKMLEENNCDLLYYSIFPQNNKPL